MTDHDDMLYDSNVADGDGLQDGYFNALNVIVPIGTILPWLKDYTNTPSLPDNFVECNGQTLSDSDSPYNGQTIPDLNGDNRFLRGNSSSGSTGGSETHNHQWMKTDAGVTYSIEDVSANNCNSYDSDGSEKDFTVSGGAISGDYYTSNTDTKPPYYTVVWVIRIK